MSLFGKVLTKLGLRKKEDTGSPPPSPQKSSGRAAPTKQTGSTRAAPDMAQKQPKKPKAVEEVDVVSQLEERAAKTPQDLNWRTSIVDLLKLLEIDSSYEARREMAVELGCPPDKMEDSAAMNIWLHKTVLQKIAENGGNIPRDLLD